MTVEIDESLLAQMILSLLAEREAKIAGVHITRLEAPPGCPNWTVQCSDYGESDPMRVEIILSNLLRGLSRKYRLP